MPRPLVPGPSAFGAPIRLLPALVVLLASCSAAPTPTSAPATPTAVAAVEVPTPTSTAAATETVAPEPTETLSPTPTENPADLTISPATLSQLRPLWMLEEPGNPNAQSGCQDTACWMLSRIGSFAFSPDGKVLAVGVCTVDSTENTTNPRHYRFNCDGPAEVRLYDSATGEVRQTLTVGDFPISLAFHPQRPILAAGMAHRSIELWDLEAGEKVGTLLHSTTHDGVEDLEFSPDGELLVSDGDDLLQLWRWERGLPAGMIEGASDFEFPPNGGTLATLTWSERGDYAEARFYPLDDLDAFRAFRLDWSKSPYRIVFTPDGSALIAIGNLELEFVDPKSGAILGEAKADDLLRLGGMSGYTRTTSELTGDGRLVLVATVEGIDSTYLDGLVLWDPHTQGAHAWLTTYEEMALVTGESYFPGFDLGGLTLAPQDGHLLVEDYSTGALVMWGIDPTAPADGVSCLGTCPP